MIYYAHGWQSQTEMCFSSRGPSPLFSCSLWLESMNLMVFSNLSDSMILLFYDFIFDPSSFFPWVSHLFCTPCTDSSIHLIPLWADSLHLSCWKNKQFIVKCFKWVWV